MQARATAASGIAGVLAALALACPQIATAQLRAPADALLPDPLPALTRTSAGRATTFSPLAAADPRSTVFTALQPWDAVGNRASLIELPVFGSTPDRLRPQYALGFQSDAMRSWMNDMGFETGQCTAPIVRMRTRIEGGDFRGALWVYARCSLR